VFLDATVGMPVVVAAVFERLDKDKSLKGKAKKKMAAK
jgi:hypothetical protein